MATLALSLSGAVAGNAIGGPLGGRVGFLAGQFLGNALFGNGDDRVSEGPRLTDLTVTSSAYGRPIPIVYGRFRVGGNVAWSPGIVEHRQGETVGGALATLASTLPPGPTATYTFGSPRVGNRAFAAGLRDLYRIVHGDDIAPKYPLPLGYRHGGEAWRLNADGSLHRGGSVFDQLIIPLTGKGIAKGVLDHRIGAYARKLARPPALSPTS